MTAAFSPFLAVRYLLTRRINLLGALGVAVAVWAMLLFNGVFTGFVSEIRSNVRNSASDLLLTGLPHNTSYELLLPALADDDVVATAPRLRHHGLLQPLRTPAYRSGPAASSQLEFDHTDNGFALLLGIDPLLEPEVSELDDWVQRGVRELDDKGVPTIPSLALLSPDASRREKLLLPDDVEWHARRRAGLPVEPDADDHRAIWPGILFGWRRILATPWIRQGEPFDLLCAAFPSDDEQGNAVLRTHTLRVAFAGWIGSGSRTFDETTALLPIETLRTLLGHDALDPNSIDLVTDVAIRVRDGLAGPALIALQRRLQQRVQPLLPAGSAPCEVLDWQQQNSVFLSAVAQEQAMMQLVLFVVMLVSAFVIYATLHMMVVQKVKDIGIVAAVGGSPRSIGHVFLLCGAVVAVIGTLLGVGAGLLSAVVLNPLNEWVYANLGWELFPRRLFDLPEIPCHITAPWVVTVALFAFALALVVAFVPARKAARMNPITALSFE